MKTNKKQEKTENGRKKVGKKERRAQRGTEMAQKLDFSHKNCREKS